jgi:ubiquinone biosynthesis O-methyltransferase
MAQLNVNGRNYDVQVEPDTPLLWVIREQVGLTGTTLDRGIRRNDTPPGDSYGTVIAKNIAAPYHQHFLNFRIDFDVDGVNNQVVEQDTTNVASSLGNAFDEHRTVLATEGARVTGIDPSERSLTVARGHAQQAGLAIDYRRGTAEDLKAAGLDGTYDLVFAVDVLEHVEDLDRTLAGVAAVLAPGGGLGFLTHNRTIAGFLQVIWEEEYVQHTMPEGFHDFARFITPGELNDNLARNDMVVQEMKGVERAGDGTGRRVLCDDLSVTYLGWALRTR